MHGLTKIPYGFDRAIKSAQGACKKVVQKLAHSVIVFCVTRILEQLMTHLLNDEQKIFRVHGGGAGPVTDLTGRYRKPGCTRTGEAGCGTYWTRRGGVCFKKSSTEGGEAGWRILRDGPRGASKFHAPPISDW
jgi:hypothetical protein